VPNGVSYIDVFYFYKKIAIPRRGGNSLLLGREHMINKVGVELVSTANSALRAAHLLVGLICSCY